MGKGAARFGLPVDAVLTGRPGLDEFVRRGFNSEMRKVNRREIEQLGNAETFALVKAKTGI
jgi:hypothetical protein